MASVDAENLESLLPLIEQMNQLLLVWIFSYPHPTARKGPSSPYYRLTLTWPMNHHHPRKHSKSSYETCEKNVIYLHRRRPGLRIFWTWPTRRSSFIKLCWAPQSPSSAAWKISSEASGFASKSMVFPLAPSQSLHLCRPAVKQLSELRTLRAITLMVHMCTSVRSSPFTHNVICQDVAR